MVIGLALFGGGDLTLLSGHPDRRSPTGCAGCCCVALYLGAVPGRRSGAVGLFISTLTEQPIGAMIAVVIFSTASFILDSHPAGRLAAPVPAHPPLAGVRRPAPRPRRLGRRAARPVRRRRLRARVLARGLGPVRGQGRHQLTAGPGGNSSGERLHRRGHGQRPLLAACRGRPRRAARGPRPRARPRRAAGVADAPAPAAAEDRSRAGDRPGPAHAGPDPGRRVGLPVGDVAAR